MQVVLPHVTYALSGETLGTILRTTHGSVLLHLSTMSEPQACFVTVQSRPTTYPAERCCPSQARSTTPHGRESCI